MMRLFRQFLTQGFEGYPELDSELWQAVSMGRPCLLSMAVQDASRLRRAATWFLATKDIRYAGEKDQLTEAALALLACQPILNLGPQWYRGWHTIFLTSDSFNESVREVDNSGIVTEYDDELVGQVTPMGPVVLSIRDLEESGRGKGYNVVVHEAAHKLDGLEGDMDGCPPLHTSMDRRSWQSAFGAAYDDFQSRLQQAKSPRHRKRGRQSLPMDEYAAEDPSEFFAVSCELFFDAPERLTRAYPEVLDQLNKFFITHLPH
jgi:hypothetical protein